MFKPNKVDGSVKICNGMISMVSIVVSNIFRSEQKSTAEGCCELTEISSSSIKMEDLPQEILVKIGSYCPPDPIYGAMFRCSKRLTIAARTNLEDAMKKIAIKAKVVKGRVVDKEGKDYGPATSNMDGKVLVVKKGVLIEGVGKGTCLQDFKIKWDWKITDAVYVPNDREYREIYGTSKYFKKLISFVTADNIIVPKIASFELRANKRLLGPSMYRSRIKWQTIAPSELPPAQIGEIVAYDDDDNIIVENQLGDRIVCFNVNNENGDWPIDGTEFEAPQRPMGLGLADQVAIINHFSYIKSDRHPLTALGLDNKGYEGYVLDTDEMPNCINLDLAEDVIIEEPVEIPA